MDKNMEHTIVYWGSMGIMAKKMETTILRVLKMLWGDECSD